MKLPYSLIVFFTLFFLHFNSFGQNCFGCNIDYSCNISPAYPTLCPMNLPDATAGIYYEEDITFYMPNQFTDNSTGVTADVTLNEVLVTGIAGLPFGINYTLSSPTNIYYPSQSEHGCVKLCGTPLAQGTYNITVSVIANISVFGIILTENF